MNRIIIAGYLGKVTDEFVRYKPLNRKLVATLIKGMIIFYSPRLIIKIM
ncbi:MAG: hypothetical protein M3449_01180 [Acidobacteriota bacterium]|nr:hypothetical protein [Acidobacteriota bacterium]MDQ3489668.1 hypothetical protein [Acidobacteriota bacterium]